MFQLEIDRIYLLVQKIMLADGSNLRLAEQAIANNPASLKHQMSG
jgi:hypothetical protein